MLSIISTINNSAMSMLSKYKRWSNKNIDVEDYKWSCENIIKLIGVQRHPKFGHVCTPAITSPVFRLQFSFINLKRIPTLTGKRVISGLKTEFVNELMFLE